MFIIMLLFDCAKSIAKTHPCQQAFGYPQHSFRTGRSGTRLRLKHPRFVPVLLFVGSAVGLKGHEQ